MATTSKVIKKLKPGEVFVFGSNADGQHIGGAAKTAVEKFGAIMGQGEGLQGDCYAIPTMEGIDSLKLAVTRFLSFAVDTPSKTFLVTAIGTGIAGHTASDIAPLFSGAPDNVVLPAEFMLEKVITSYKGFDKSLQCRGFQYEIGKTYTHKGAVTACGGGFHACHQHPLAVLTYYGLRDGNRYALVEQSGALDQESDKTASQKIKITAEIGVPGLIKAAIEWTKKSASPTSGNYAHSATSGDYAHSATSGYYAHSATSGNYAHSATSGYYANSATSGDYANSATSGDSAHSATSGYYANSATSGYYANSATSGDSAHSATSGDYANSATSGDSAHSATSGDYANSATSGYYAQCEAKGVNAVAANAGDGAAKAGKAGAIFLVERGKNREILSVFASKVGENGIEADTWYVLRGGKAVVYVP